MPTLAERAKKLGDNFDRLANSKLIVGHLPKDRVRDAQRRVKNIENHTADLQRYAFADMAGKALDGTGEGAYRAYIAFSTGRNKEGAAEVLRMVGSAALLLRMVGRIGGPAGIFIGELLGLVASIIQGVEAPQLTVGEELEKELHKFSGDLQVHQLAGVYKLLQAIGNALTVMDADDLSYESLLSIGQLTGNSVKWLGEGESWLLDEKKQDLDIWGQVFEAHCLAVSEYLQNWIRGLDKLKRYNARGDATSDFRMALDLLDKTLLDMTFVDQILPVAVNKGTLWYIGTNDVLFTRRKVVSKRNSGDTRYTSLGGLSKHVVVGPSERIWTLNEQRDVHTGIGPTPWPTAIGGVDDFWVTEESAETSFEAGNPAKVSHIYTITKGHDSLNEKVWDEALGEKKALEQVWKNTVTEVLPKSLGALHIAVTKGGIIYLLCSGSKRTYIWPPYDPNKTEGPYKNMTSMICRALYRLAPGGTPSQVFPVADAQGMALTESRVYLYSDRELIWRDTTGQNSSKIVWNAIPNPDPALGLKDDWRYTHVATCEDGSLVAAIGEALFQWFEGGWEKHGQDDKVVRLFKQPVRGWELFIAIRTTIKDLKKMSDNVVLHTFAQVGPAHYHEVTVKDTGYYPNKVTIKPGSRVVWKWETTGAETVTSVTDLFKSEPKTRESQTGFEFTFRDTGEFDYFSNSNPLRIRGKVIVKE